MGAREPSIGIGLSWPARDGIIKLLRGPGIDSLFLLGSKPPTAAFEIGPHATEPGGIGSLESILGLIKILKIRAQGGQILYR
jgi:hypothetical protein